ncbi:MAG: glutamyl-tRNA reductase [Gammaproteobacteria bacterium]
MSLSVFGVNHKTAPVSIRENVAVDADGMVTALRSIINQESVIEAVVLSTCNRTEVYCYHDNLFDDQNKFAINWLSEHFNLEEVVLEPYLFSLKGDDSVRHLLRVACGLDSMVLGEPQILGQIKEAYRVAADTGTVEKTLNKLFQHSFSVAKRVRTDTEIGSSPVSVAFAAVRLAQQVFGDLSDKTALMIGAGDTVELASQHLQDNDLGRMIIANRSIEKAQVLASRFNGYAIALKDLPLHLAEADILISSTASQLPILGKGAVERALKERKRKPMFMIDIAVPRDIETEIGMLDDVYLYTVDDLETVIEENQKSRQTAALQAEEIILAETRNFIGWQQSLDAVSTVRALRENIQAPQKELIKKAKQHLARGEDPEKVIEALARGLTQKFTHMPSVKLRGASADRQEELIKAVKELFDLS